MISLRFVSLSLNLIVLPFDRPLITTRAMVCNFRLLSKTSDVLHSCRSGRLNVSTGVRARLISGQKFQLPLAPDLFSYFPNRKWVTAVHWELLLPVFPEAAWEASDTSSAKHHNNTAQKKKGHFFFPPRPLWSCTATVSFLNTSSAQSWLMLW